MENHLRIKEWIMAGEGRELEFKTRVPAPQKMAKTVCAFANTRGGHIVVGVMDDGEIVGIVDEEVEKKLLLEAANYYCCLLYTSPSPRDRSLSRMPSSA